MRRMKQLGKEGWDGVGCGMLIARELWTVPRGGPANPWLLWGQPCSEQGAAGRLGTPSPNASVSLGTPAELSAAAHPAPCRAPRRPGPFPCPPWHVQAHREFGAFSAGAAGTCGAVSAPRQVPRTAARG